MKIAVNARLLVKNKLKGRASFAYQILKRLSQENLVDEFVFFFDREIDRDFVFAPNVTAERRYPKTYNSFFSWLFFQISLFFAIKKHKADIFFSPEGYLCLPSKTKKICVIHDICFEKHPEFFENKIRLYFLKRNYPKFAKKADKILTVSEFTKQDIIDCYKIDANKIDVIYDGVDEKYKAISELESFQTRLKYSNGKAFFIYIGYRDKKSNITNMLKAFEIFKREDTSEAKLIIVGFKNDKTIRNKQIANLWFQKDLVFISHLETKELNKLLASSLALVYPSLYEGFGLPILEAFHSETAVICSKLTAMPEVAGDAALYCDPNNPENIANQMNTLISTPKLRENLIEKGRKQRTKFSWDSSAEKIWENVVDVISDK
jgi:glycosyltransferase involved in cell wall biosynthesis